MTKPENPHKATIRNPTDSGETPGRMWQLAGERRKGAACSVSTHRLSWRPSTKGNSNCRESPEASTDLDHGWHQGQRRVIGHHTSCGCPVPWGEQASPQWGPVPQKYMPWIITRKQQTTPHQGILYKLLALKMPTQPQDRKTDAGADLDYKKQEYRHRRLESPSL